MKVGMREALASSSSIHNHFGLFALAVKWFEKGAVEFAKDRGHHLELGFASDVARAAGCSEPKMRCEDHNNSSPGRYTAAAVGDTRGLHAN